MNYHPSPEQEARDERRLRILGTFDIAVILPAGLGTLFSVVGGRPFWHTGLFPITFVVSALLSGAALVFLIESLFFRGGHAFRETVLSLGRLVGVLLAIEGAVLFSEALIVLRGGSIPSHVAALKAIVAGPFAWVFWIVQIVAGTLIPLVLIFFTRRQTLTKTGLASVLILAGVFAFRLNVVIPQLAQPAFESMPEAYLHPRWTVTYVPSYMEWNYLLFGIGLAGVILLMGHRLLPLTPRNRALEFEVSSYQDKQALP